MNKASISTNELEMNDKAQIMNGKHNCSPYYEIRKLSLTIQLVASK